MGKDLAPAGGQEGEAVVTELKDLEELREPTQGHVGTDDANDLPLLVADRESGADSGSPARVEDVGGGPEHPFTAQGVRVPGPVSRVEAHLDVFGAAFADRAELFVAQVDGFLALLVLGHDSPKEVVFLRGPGRRSGDEDELPLGIREERTGDQLVGPDDLEEVALDLLDVADH